MTLTQPSASTRSAAQRPGDCLATGAAGVALMHIELARTGAGTWATAHEHVTAMTRDPVTAHPGTASLYRGAPAVAFVLHTAQQPAYAAALARLDAHTDTVVRQRLAAANARIDYGHLPRPAEFDLISGLTGLGAHLLHRRGGGDLLHDLLRYLVRLAQPLRIDGQTLPGWWCQGAPGGQPAAHWPAGHGDLGLAHGITGPLALLALTARRRFIVEGQTNAIARICSWLDRWQHGTGRSAWWPETVSRAEQQTGAARQHGPQRPSWCYGTPGISRAQQLAALALDDPHRQRSAEQALAACVADDGQLALLVDASLCHGWVGLVHTTHRAAADAGPDSPLTTHLPRLRTLLHRHLSQHGPPGRPGLLEGAAGLRLAQHTAAPDAVPATRWDTCLLLDG